MASSGTAGTAEIDKKTMALKISDHIDDIINGRIYKDGIYKDDDVTLKSEIKERDTEELMKLTKINLDYLILTKKAIEDESILLTEEEEEKINTKKTQGEEFYLRGSTNFIPGFDSPRFYIEGNTLFFQVKVIEGQVDLAEITRRVPGEKPSTRIAGGVLNDGIIVKVPIEIDSLTKYPRGTSYTVSLTSTNNASRASFNYTQ